MGISVSLYLKVSTNRAARVVDDCLTSFVFISLLDYQGYNQVSLLSFHFPLCSIPQAIFIFVLSTDVVFCLFFQSTCPSQFSAHVCLFLFCILFHFPSTPYLPNFSPLSFSSCLQSLCSLSSHIVIFSFPTIALLLFLVSCSRTHFV